MHTGRDRDHGMSDLLAEVGLGGLLHLDKNHSANFLGCLSRSTIKVITSVTTHWGTYEFTFFAFEPDRDGWLSTFVNNIEWPVLHVFLKICFVHLTSNETFGIKNSVARV